MLLEANEVTKRFGTIDAVDGLFFGVQRGRQSVPRTLAVDPNVCLVTPYESISYLK